MGRGESNPKKRRVTAVQRIWFGFPLLPKVAWIAMLLFITLTYVEPMLKKPFCLRFPVFEPFKTWAVTTRAWLRGWSAKTSLRVGDSNMSASTFTVHLSKGGTTAGMAHFLCSVSYYAIIRKQSSAEKSKHTPASATEFKSQRDRNKNRFKRACRRSVHSHTSQKRRTVLVCIKRRLW